MKIETYDWTGKDWNAPNVNTAKTKLPNIMTAICSSYLLHDLMAQGHTIREGRITKDTPAVEGGNMFTEGTSNGMDLTWMAVDGIGDDVLILSNLDEMHIFYGFKSTHFERTEDQMPLLLAQHQAVTR